jgi:hypothetical protein
VEVDTKADHTTLPGINAMKKLWTQEAESKALGYSSLPMGRRELDKGKCLIEGSLKKVHVCIHVQMYSKYI